MGMSMSMCMCMDLKPRTRGVSAASRYNEVTARLKSSNALMKMDAVYASTSRSDDATASMLSSARR